MSPQERRASFALSSIYIFRLLGLFMVLPIFSLYAHGYKGANPALIGMALGIYGLTQCLLQIPFGVASDHLGRKPVIIFGLILFIIGSIIAACAHNIDEVILGRAIQGAGAIGGTLIALLADVTSEQNRLKAMSFIGIGVGIAFIGAMALGPIVNGLTGLSGIFWLTAGLATLSILILLYFVPTPVNQYPVCRDLRKFLKQFKQVLMHPELLRLDYAVFTLHTTLMASFVVLPFLLVEVGIPKHHESLLYVPILLVSCGLILPLVFWVSKHNRFAKSAFLSAILILIFSQLLLRFLPHHLLLIIIILLLFFSAFIFLEANLPFFISKVAPKNFKGGAMGIYASAEFFGDFCGGAGGGILVHHFGFNSIPIVISIIGVLWFLLALAMKPPAPSF